MLNKCVFRISRLGFGGAERVFLSVGKVLQQNYGFEIIFVTDRSGGDAESVAIELGFKVETLNAKRTLFSVFKFAKLLKELQPSIVVSAYPDTNAAALLSRLLLGKCCPIIVTEHSSIKKHWANFSWLTQAKVKFFVSYIYQLADQVVCVSDGLKKEVIELQGRSNAAVTIYNPVRFSAELVVNTLPQSDVKQILAVGRISKQKDYLTLLKAIEILKDKNLKLTILGGVYNQADADEAYSFVKLNQLEDKVEFVGFTQNPEIYYQRADLFVLSSAWEGFGNVIVEALAFGLPVVSTDCESGPAEILESGKYGRLVPVGDFQAMASEINSVLAKNPYEPANQIARSKDFSEQEIGKQYYELIKSLMDK